MPYVFLTIALVGLLAPPAYLIYLFHSRFLEWWWRSPSDRELIEELARRSPPVQKPSECRPEYAQEGIPGLRSRAANVPNAEAALDSITGSDTDSVLGEMTVTVDGVIENLNDEAEWNDDAEAVEGNAYPDDEDTENEEPCEDDEDAYAEDEDAYTKDDDDDSGFRNTFGRRPNFDDMAVALDKEAESDTWDEYGILEPLPPLSPSTRKAAPGRCPSNEVTQLAAPQFASNDILSCRAKLVRNYKTIDANQRKEWKALPIRISSGRCPTCSQLRLLVQVSPGGFVMQRCKCRKLATLRQDDLNRLDLWIACPFCRRRMGQVMDRGIYGYACDDCECKLKLADIVPDDANCGHP